MNKYKIQIDKRCIKELAKIPLKDRQKIDNAINDLAKEPRPMGYIEMKGSKKITLFRIRCGNYRIIYSIQDVILTVHVLKIGDRKEIYQ